MAINLRAYRLKFTLLNLQVSILSVSTAIGILSLLVFASLSLLAL
ncbi:MAG: hypothetical protein AAFV72_23235 [Cyanobacteria bacterium J06635_1]